MRKRNVQDALAKFLSFVLGRNPHELGLIPDAEGYVKIKDLLKAIREEEGWGHVRHGHLNEVMLVAGSSPIEINGGLVRAVDRGHLPPVQPAQDPPKQMFTFIRRKAYPVVLERGVLPWAQPYVILSPDLAMIERIGKRYDAHPVVLTVSVRRVMESGAGIHHVGGNLYTCEQVRTDCFTGPALSKVRDEHRPKAAEPAPSVPKTPGSFILDVDDGRSERASARSKKDRKDDWKRERKRMNRRGKGNGLWE